VHRGDWVVGDADGVALVPRTSLERVLDAACARAAKESRLFTELRAGRTTLELLELDPAQIETD
jgi:4-hydroxy-4-methyl-2-oxoglutarate aldolase